jgi:hypothetical protein
MTRADLTFATLLASGVFVFAAAPALAKEVHVFKSSFGSAGAGPGQFEEPAGVAVNDETGDVYVVDKGNDRVEYFSATGTYEGEFNGSGLNLNEGIEKPSTGRLERPEWIAVDNDPSSESKGDVYVTDNGHKVIDKFGASGEYLGQITKTFCPEPDPKVPPYLPNEQKEEGEACPPGSEIPFTELYGVAVDATGELWVYQSIAENGDEGSNVSNGVVDHYSDAGANTFEGSLKLYSRSSGVRAAPGFAVGPGDALHYMFHIPGYKTIFVGGAGSTTTSSTAGAVNLSNGDLYVDEGKTVFEATGSETFGSGRLSAGTGLAVNSSTVSGNTLSNGVYVADGEADRVDFFPDVVVPDVTTEPASGVGVKQEAGYGVLSATLNGKVNPAGLLVTSCEFEYGISTFYGSSRECSTNPGSGSAEVPVAANLTLLPGTTYHYRLRVANENDESEPEAGSDETFTTPGPGIEAASSVDVASTSAELNATIDPNRAPTSYRFEYDTRAYGEGEASHGTTVPVPNVSIGSGETAVQVVPESIQGLAAGTVYHYRVVAVSELEVGGVSEAITFDGPDQTFTTQSAGSFMLPDGRQWEMVSPPDKHGAGIESLNFLSGVVQVAAGGGAISYKASAPTESAPQGDLSGGVQVLSTRGGGNQSAGTSSWSSRDITSPHASGTGKSVGGAGEEYRFFSEDLSQAVVQPFGSFLPCVSAQGATQPCLSPEASEQTPFLHGLQAGAYTPLVTGCPAKPAHCEPAVEEHADVPAGTVFTDEALEREGSSNNQVAFGPHFRGATPNLSHIVLQSARYDEVPLTETSPVANEGGLYEYSAGRLALVSVLPDGVPVHPAIEVDLALGELSQEREFLNAQHAISADGSRVVFSTNPQANETTHLYLRENALQPQSPIEAGKCTIASDACTVQLDSGLAGSAEFQTANSETTEVFFTDGGDLYEYDVKQGRLLTLTEGAEVQGSVLGASEDGSCLYFVAKGKLAQGATPGQPNLYLLHDGAIGLVAVLSGEDEHDWQQHLAEMPARVAPDGEWLAFMSQRRLTGYDNLDASSGEPDQEVYLYHAGSGGAGSLTCASCDPTGARPTGAEFRPTETLIGSSPIEGEHVWIAGSVPGWLNYEHYGAIYQPRYLSDSGRLFFDSPDALVPLDVNGTQDVYEYEPEGARACSAASTSGSEVFKPVHAFEVEGVKSEEGAGCVALISSGTSSEESIFLDASASGGDVFFMTAAKLAPQDYDTSYDVYDAHECTSEAPCPVASVPPPECDTEASCKSSPTPQPNIYGLPSSAVFSGSGNVTPAHPAPVVKPRAKILRCEQGLVRKKVKKNETCVKKPRKKAKAKKKRKKNSKAKKSAHVNPRAAR